MFINKIELQNFRQFAGKNNEISFSTDPDKNITIVMGDNGSGKTTLAQAFLWCLYGDTEFTVKEVINRDIRDAMTPNDEETVKVDLYITKEIDGEQCLYRISRRQKFKRTYSKLLPLGTEFTVSQKNDKKGEWDFMNDGQAKVFIKQTIPYQLSKFFFFDGERIEKLSKEIDTGKSNEFKTAVQGLVGLTAMLNAINHMKPSSGRNTVIGSIQKDIDANGTQNLRDISKRIEEYQNIIDECEPKIEIIDDEIRTYSLASDKKQKEIIGLSDALKVKKEYEETESLIKVKTIEKNKKIRNLLSDLSNHCFELFSMPLTKTALEQLDQSDHLEKGIPYLHVDTLKFLLERGKCLCGEDCGPGSEHAKELYALMDIALPKTIGEAIGTFADKSKVRIRNAEEFTNRFESLFLEIRKLNSEIENLSTKSTNLFNQMVDTSMAQTLRDEVKSYQSKIASLNREKGAIEEQINTAKRKLGYAEADRDKMILVDDKNKRAKLKLAYAKHVFQKLTTVYENKETQTRHQLQDTINDLFSTIYDNGIRLEVDSSYGLRAIVTDTTSTGDELERNTALNYAIIFAFISSILKLAHEKSNEDDGINLGETGYPLVMDAPLSAFDKTRIKNICETIPNIAQQVIMFIKDTDGEIAEENFKDKIGEKYFINATSKTNSIIVRRDQYV